MLTPELNTDLWERTLGSANEVKAVGAVSNGAMTLYTHQPHRQDLADFDPQDRIDVPTVRLYFNATINATMLKWRPSSYGATHIASTT